MSLNDFEIIYTDGITLRVLSVSTLRAALDHFQARHGRLPHALHVHPASVPATENIIAMLNLEIPVRSNGGALFGEIWLQTNGEETPHD